MKCEIEEVVFCFQLGVRFARLNLFNQEAKCFAFENRQRSTFCYASYCFILRTHLVFEFTQPRYIFSMLATVFHIFYNLILECVTLFLNVGQFSQVFSYYLFSMVFSLFRVCLVCTKLFGNEYNQVF